MKQFLSNLFLIVFLWIILACPVFAADVVKTCNYTFTAAYTADGEADYPYRDGTTLTITIYSDGTHKGTSNSSHGPDDGNGTEELLNWGQSKNGIPATSTTSCPDYIIADSEGMFEASWRWYGLDKDDFSDCIDDFVEMDTAGRPLIYKWDDLAEETPTYRCEYEEGYVITVDTQLKTLTVTNSSLPRVSSYTSSDALRESWFRSGRDTTECMQTVACYQGYSGGMNRYVIYENSMSAGENGQWECNPSPCLNGDCDNESNACDTYASLLKCSGGDCSSDTESIQGIYYHIANNDSNEAVLYQKVHEKEAFLESNCKGIFTHYDYSDDCFKACLKLEQDLAAIKDEYGISTTPGDSNSCNISERLAAWLIRIISWIRYIVPVVIIILTILDFIKAIAADNEDEIKKVSGKFAKRLIVALIIFLLPLLLEFILGIFGQDTYQYCLK